MIAVVPVIVCAGVCLLAVIAELRGRQARPTELSRGHRAGLAFLVGLVGLVALSPQLALVLDRPLPVAPPANPLAGDGCGDSSGDDTLVLVIALAVYLGARTGLGVVAALVRAIARPPARVVTGKPAMTVAAIFLGVIFPIVSARLLLPGPSPADFTTHGALTPDAGARGWRAEHTIDASRAGPLVPLRRLDRPVSDTTARAFRGHGSFAPERSLAPGLHGWVGGAPVLIYSNGAALVGAPVASRAPDEVPPERRPHFQSWPHVAPRSDTDGWLLVEHRRDGARFAVQTDASGKPEGVDHRDVWLLVRPSEIPHGIAFVLFLLGLAAALASQRRGHSPGLALVAAWLWLEAGAVDLFAYAPYLGL